jgi:hypothetical protein
MGRVLLRMDTFPEKVFVSLLIPQGVCSWIQVVKKNQNNLRFRLSIQRIKIKEFLILHKRIILTIVNES